MFVALALAAATIQVDVTVNGIDSGRTCRVQNLETEAEAASGERVDWDLGQGADVRIYCRRATGDLVQIVKGVRGQRRIDLKMGFAIVWTEREGERIDGRLVYKRIGGDERIEAKPGAQTPLIAGSWSLESFDDNKRGWRDDRIEVRQGATLERTVDLAPGRVRLLLAGGKGQVDVLDSQGRSAGYGPTGSWIELPPNRYTLTVTRREDLAQKPHAIGQFVLRPEAAVERRANPTLGILRWALNEPLGELKLYDASGEKLLAEGLQGDRWKVSPGLYRVSYQLPSAEVLGVDFGAKAEAVEVIAGRAVRFGKTPLFGQAVVRLRRGQSPQYGQVELLNPADGELAGRFAIGQMVRIAPGRWPLRVVASDGQVIPYAKPLVVRHGDQMTVDLQRKQSRLRVTLTKNGQRAKGVWQVFRGAQDEPLQGVSGEALDLDPGQWTLRVRCATGRGGQERPIQLILGADLEEEFLCN